MTSTYIVSLYAAGQRIAGDCVPDFFATREDAEMAATACLSMARAAREQGDMLIGWPVRYTIRRERLSQHDAAVIAKHGVTSR